VWPFEVDDIARAKCGSRRVIALQPPGALAGGDTAAHFDAVDDCVQVYDFRYGPRFSLAFFLRQDGHHREMPDVTDLPNSRALITERSCHFSSALS
jgi:hypothetical protein